MSNIQPLADTTELVELLKSQGLYLKPIARLFVTVQLPLIKDPGKTISNWDLMEKIKKMIRPHQFITIRVCKSTLEFVRFEAEVDNRRLLEAIVTVLDNGTVKIIGFYEALKVRASEAKLAFPTRHDWDSFFRETKGMSEVKPGERPDTVYLGNLPCLWFVDRRHKAKDAAERGEPSEFALRRVFETFGDVRCVDIPTVDPFRKHMSKSGLQQMSKFGPDVTFEAYVQFSEYISFVKCMDALRGMKLVYFDAEANASTANIKVDFDRSKHLSDRNIRKRRLERERLVLLEAERLEREQTAKEEQRLRDEEEKRRMQLGKIKELEDLMSRRREREEKRRLRQLERKRRLEQQELERKIGLEERKLLLAERELGSVRLLGELLRRIQIIKQKEQVERELQELEEAKMREEQGRMQTMFEERNRKQRLLMRREQMLRSKVLQSWKKHENERKEFVRGQLLRNLPQDAKLKSSLAGFIAGRGSRGLRRGRVIVVRGRGRGVGRGHVIGVRGQLRRGVLRARGARVRGFGRGTRVDHVVISRSVL